MRQLSKQEKIDFADFFFDEYLVKRNFGSMTKTDFEVMVYSFLKSSVLSAMTSNERSIALKISRAKVTNLDYQSSLKYSDNTDEKLMPKVIECIQKAQFSRDGNKVQFVVEEKIVWNFINSKLYEINAFNDTSFNKDIVSIDILFFAQFVDKYIFADEKYDRDKQKLIQEVDNLFPENELVHILPKEKTGQLMELKSNSLPKASKFANTLGVILYWVSRGLSEGATAGLSSPVTAIFDAIPSITEIIKIIKDTKQNKKS